jgi:hypothetical protein
MYFKQFLLLTFPKWSSLGKVKTQLKIENIQNSIIKVANPPKKNLLRKV